VTGQARTFAEGYIDVATRLAEFREKHPGGSLQPADLSQPYRIEQIGEQTYIVVVAAAFRTADDARPGVGMAYEVFPGRTPYTKGSELQNAETSAWGRAIVAALAADTRQGVASADEVRNRTAERGTGRRDPELIRAEIATFCQEEGRDLNATAQDFADNVGVPILKATAEQLEKFLAALRLEIAA
jgi:hypothetical protein